MSLRNTVPLCLISWMCLGMFYPRYLTKISCEEALPRHLLILMEWYRVGIWGANKLVVPLMIGAHLLDVQPSYFKICMKNNSTWAMEHHVH